MSKGGAGKVYFVLYLAVILELLIIFIERDEAEEHLRKEQRQAIEIVQTILSQMQTGSGTSGITVNPKDNIVLDEKTPSNNVRNYDVVVSVGDKKAVVNFGGKTIKGDDVPKLEYIVSHIGNPNLADSTLGDDTTDIVGGTQVFKAELGTDIGSYDNPKQTFGTSIPAADPAHYFYLNNELTAKTAAAGHKAKVFSVNFKPNLGPGWYRLRFTSETNKIMGIAGVKPSPTDTIRIGNVKLTVKQLEQVQKAMARKRKSGDTASTVEKYISALLTPDAYKGFSDNHGSQSFNVRVTKPEARKPQDPVAEILLPRDTVYWYTGAPFSVPVRLGPKEGTKDMSGGARLVEVDPATNRYNAVIDKPEVGFIPLIAKATNAGQTDISEKTLSVEAPAYRGGVDKWKGLRAVVSRKYNPSSDWASTVIPDDHYQTVVEINGREVFNHTGVSFKDAELPADMLVTEQTKSIKTTVYWKPGGTADRTQWVALLSNEGGAVIPLAKKKFEIGYPAPEQTDGFEFTFVISPKKLKDAFSPIVLTQKIGENRSIPVQNAIASCTDCAEYGISVRLNPSGDNYELLVEADRAKLKPSIVGHRFDILIDMTGRGGATGTGIVALNVKAGK